MREIKFRAWDSKKKEWLLGYNYGSLGGFSLFGECVLLGEWSNILDTYLFERGGHKFSDLKVMQYIGVKDRTGREIYEGDIVEFSFDRGMGEEAFIEEVVFSDGNFSPYNTGSVWGENSEVVGNIYENRELIKSLASKMK